MENPTPEPSLSPAAPQAEAITPAEAPASPAPEPAPAANAATDADPLMALAVAAKAARLSPADEDHAATLLKERLSGNRAAIKTALSAMTEGLPWIVCVNALCAAWEGLNVPTRRHILSSLAKVETEPARRLRLSLARGLVKTDPAAGLKLAASAAAGLKDPETGALSAKHRQYFFNVFIGKGKPWLIQLPLGDLKPAEAEPLLHAAIESFTFCPPFSQLSVLRWIHDAGRFKKIAPADLAAAAKSLGRWNLKYQRQLKAELPDLPAELEAALKPEALKPEALQPAPPAEARPEPKAERRAPETQAPEATGEKQAQPAAETPSEAEPAEPKAAAAAPEELIIPGRAEREKARAKEKERRPEKGRPFDLKDTLRGIEAYVANLRGELETAKTQLHRQEKRRERPGHAEEALPAGEAEALKRHNARLEADLAELRARLEELTRDGEAVAESRQMYGEAPLPEEGAQALKALLAIKLQDAFETYHAMRLEPLDKVFRLDYRDLLGSVFDVLLEQGVALKKQKPEA